MKILSLRLNGVNSIYGSEAAFIDFENSKIASSGLFAITGPTGAGKSTILDAIALALYGYTPRLGKVTPSNVGELLNRKSVEAFAEVEYMVEDERYLSRWSVHRSNKKLSGNIRNPEVILQHFQQDDWVVLQSGLEPWRKENEIRTGLSFKNFKYSVLLAQGQFADFIQGSDTEKAEILKTLTQTEEFSELGQKCFEIHKAINIELKDLINDADIQRDDLYTEEEIKDLKKDIEKIHAQQSKSKENLDKSREWLEYEKTWIGLQKEVENSIAHQEKYRLEFSEFQSQLEKLNQHRRVEKLVPIHKELEDLQRRISKITTELGEAKVNQDVILHKVDDVESQWSILQTEEAIHKQAQEEFRGWSEKVRAPLQKIETLKLQNQDALETLESCQKEDKKWKIKGEHLEGEIQKIETQIGEIQRWISLYPNGISLKSQLAPWIGEIAQELNRCKDISDEEMKLAQLRLGISEAKTSLAEQIREIEPSRKKIENHHTKIAKLEDVIQENKSRSENKQSLMESEEHRLQKELKEAREFSEFEAEVDQLEKQLKFHHDSLGELSQKQKAIDVKKVAAKNLRNSRYDLVQTKKEILKLQAFKHLLIDGDPCPLCGSLEHSPNAAEVPNDLAEFEKDLVKSEAALLEIEQEERELLNIQNKAQFDSKETIKRIEFLKAKLKHEGTTTKWSHQLTIKLEEYQVHEKAYEQYLAELKNLEAKSVELRHLKSDTLRLETENEDNELKIKSSQERISKLEWSLEKQNEKLAQDQHWLSTQNQKWASRLSSPSFTGWKGLRELKNFKDREVFQEEASKWLKDFEDKNRIQQEQQKDLHGKQVEQRQWKAQGGQIQTRLQQATTKYEKINHDLELANAQLDQILAGRVVETESQKLKAQESHLAQNKSRLEDLRSELQKQKSAVNNTIELKTAESKDLDKQFHSKQTQLLQRLNALEIESIESFQSLLLAQKDHESLSVRERELREEEIRIHETIHSIDLRKTKCEQRLKNSWDRFQDSNYVEFEPAAEVFCQKFEKEIEDLNKKLWDLQAKIKTNEDLQKDMGELLKKISLKEKEKARWAKLEALIGQSDGAKFNLIAQSLNLRRLVDQANEFLSQLRSRYTLQVDDSIDPFSLKLVVIDKEQDYQMRQLVNLSGGETFQLSLALALGLSELSSGGCQLESLFIDEGFGTLDQETLAQVLVALQGLRATGKTVGIITHVGGIREHIPYGVELKVHSGGRGEICILD